MKRRAEARFTYVPHFADLSGSFGLSHSSDLPKVLDVSEAPPASKTAMPDTAAILLAFFAGVTQPIAEMDEALYLSTLLRDTYTVWEILRRMAQSAGVKP